jgi:alkaline phosphatase D
MRRVRFSRRQMIAGLALAACGPARNSIVDPQAIDKATKVRFAPEAIPLSTTLFPQTVASGAMKPDSAVLWTRASGADEVTLRVWREVSSTEVALVTEQKLPVPDGGNVKVKVEGLAAATWYRYGFFDGPLQQRSPLGKVRTAFPADWKEPLTVGATSCASYRYAPFTPLVAMGEQKLDFWVHLGDVSYNDGAGSLDEFRTKWKAQLADPGYRALMPSAGGYLIWDDHDFVNNVDPEAMGPTHPLIVAGKASWFETLPVERGPNDRIWTSYRWGKTAEFFVMDCRMERRPSTRETAGAQYLSREQMDWLKDGVKNSPCHFKVLCNSVPITLMPPPLWGSQGDRWQGYVAAREELLGFLDAQDIQNVWFLSGDFHLGLVMRVEKAGARRRLIEIAAGPAGNINPLSLVLEPGQEANKKLAFPPDQFLFAGGGFLTTTLTFDPQADTVRVVFIDPSSGATPLYDQRLTFGKV